MKLNREVNNYVKELTHSTSLQDISTCNLGPLMPGLEVDDSLDELFPLLSLEAPAGFSSMAYTEHLISGSHYLFLGTRGGRLFQVMKSCLQWYIAIAYDCIEY